MADVNLLDLETIRRFCVAVRAETAPRLEVIQALEADLEALKADRRAERRRGGAEKAAAKKSSGARRPGA